MNVNIPYADMTMAVAGPANPFVDRNKLPNQNAIAGHVEEHAMTDHAFRARCLRDLCDRLQDHLEDLRDITIAEVGAPHMFTTGPQLEGPIADLGWLADLGADRPLALRVEKRATDRFPHLVYYVPSEADRHLFDEKWAAGHGDGTFSAPTTARSERCRQEWRTTTRPTISAANPAISV